nr:DUF3310 domain-containing protein [Listeria seeligeri]
MVELEGQGYTWISGSSPTSKELVHWKKYGPETVISAAAEVLRYGNIQYYKNEFPDTPIRKYKAKNSEWARNAEKFATTWKEVMESHLIESTGTSDNINNPSHYTAGGIETLDYIKAKVSDYPSYAVGNIVKYVSRYEHKNGIEDLKKAQFYLNDLIEEMEKGA